MEKKTLIILLLPAILCFPLFSLFSQVQAVYEETNPPWLGEWLYRKSHVINSASGASTDYQVKIVVHYGSGSDSSEDVYCNSHCRTDFGDIRFTDADATTELDYWTEEKTDGDKATFWVKVKDDLSSQNRTIYMYYGRSDATTLSDLDRTFIFAEDWELKNTARWTTTYGSQQIVSLPVYGGTSAYKIDTGLDYPYMASYARKTLSASPREIATAVAVRPNTIRGSCLYLQSIVFQDSSNNNFIYLMEVNSNGYLQLVKWTGTSGAGHWLYYQGTRIVLFTDNVDIRDTWSKIVLKATSSKVELLRDSTSVWSSTNSVDLPSSNQYLKYVYNTDSCDGGTVAQDCTGGGIVYTDNLYIRKCVEPEPSHGSWGNEEIPYPPPIRLSIELSGDFDYSVKEEVKVRLGALVKDANTFEPVLNASVTIEIYFPNSTLWISDQMVENLAGTGIYEWESSNTIYDMKPPEGVYLVHVKASVDNGPIASDFLLFHIDPPSEDTTSSMPLVCCATAIIIISVAGAITGITLVRKNRARQLTA